MQFIVQFELECFRLGCTAHVIFRMLNCSSLIFWNFKILLVSQLAVLLNSGLSVIWLADVSANTHSVSRKVEVNNAFCFEIYLLVCRGHLWSPFVL